MAHHPEMVDEQISALTTSLHDILKVQDSTTPLPSYASLQQQQSLVPNDETMFSTTSSVLGSAKISLCQFSLLVQPPVTKVGQEPHVILHVDGTLASASPVYGEGSDPSMPLEVVQLDLISDKVPLSGIPAAAISSDAMFLVKFWADFNFDAGSSDLPASFYVKTIFESSKMMQISCKTSVCSFGRSIGDKVEKLPGTQIAPNRVIYQNIGASLCDYLVNFIQKLKGCEQVATMNGVLENFSVLQVISDDVTKDTLLCFLYVFEVCPLELCATTGAMCKVYRLDGSASNPGCTE